MPEYEAERQRLWEEIDVLLNLKELPAARKARQLLREWLAKHPDDYYSQDGGEEVAMMEGALEIIEAERATRPAST